MNFEEQMCFTCLRKDPVKLVELVSFDEDNISFLEKLEACVTSNLIGAERMEICETCIGQLKSSYNFKEVVLQSQETWRRYYDDIKTNTCLVMTDNSLEYEKYALVELENCPTKVEDQDDNKFNDSDLLENTESDKDNDVLSHCDTCNKSFTNSRGLASHVCEEAKEITAKIKNKAKSKLRKESYTCISCNICFNKKWKLLKHNERIHLQAKKYVCTFCGKSFKQSYHLREHMTSHTGERNYTCHICGKTFQRMSSQKRHLKAHERPPGDKVKKTPFLCTVCGKSFPYSNGHQRHMRIHSGDRKFQCSVCPKRFMQSTHLHVHMRTHTGEKPYVCESCGEAFSLKATLQKHTNLHLNIMKLESEPKTGTTTLENVMQPTVYFVHQVN